MEKAEEICYNNEEERKRLRYLLMLNMTPEELKDFFPEDEIIKKFRDEIMRLNSDTKFIREISEEEKIMISKQEGQTQGYNEGINTGINYNVPISVDTIRRKEYRSNSKLIKDKDTNKNHSNCNKFN